MHAPSSRDRGSVVCPAGCGASTCRCPACEQLRGCHYVESVKTPRCPHCRSFAYLDSTQCPSCAGALGYELGSRTFFAISDDGAAEVDGTPWYLCSNSKDWGCNWLVDPEAGSGRCFSCRLTRTGPDSDNTIALEKLASTEVAKRRLIVQLLDLGLPIRPWTEGPGGLGFDLTSSLTDGTPVRIGHANGIITIDLAESLDARREALRVKLGEPYRTMLGHLRHEVGHYFQMVLVQDDDTLTRCRELFGDERASYQDAIKRHYKFGAPADWHVAHISEYATMHPWEDFAETFAHYLHITGTLGTAAATGLQLDASVVAARDEDVVPLSSYQGESIQRLLSDWAWFSRVFNRVNRSMGMGDLYPFELTPRVGVKLAFMHRLISSAAAIRKASVSDADGLVLVSPEG